MDSNIRSLAYYRRKKAMSIDEKIQEWESSFSKDIEHLQDVIVVLQQRVKLLEQRLSDVESSKSK